MLVSSQQQSSNLNYYITDKNPYNGVEFKKEFGNEFYKCINKEHKQMGFQWKIGLNIDTNKFYTTGTHKAGLYFTNRDRIHNYLTYGNYICTLRIPDEATIVIDDPQGEACRADRLYLEKMTLIKDFEFWSDPEYCAKISPFNPKVSIYFKIDYNLHLDKCGIFLLFAGLSENLNQKKCLQAVKTYGTILGNIPIEKRSEKVCLSAVKNDPAAVIYVPKNKLNNKIKYEVIKKNPSYFTIIENPNEKMCICVTKKSTKFFLLIENHTQFM